MTRRKAPAAIREFEGDLIVSQCLTTSSFAMDNVVESNVTEKVWDLFFHVGWFCLFITPFTFLISVIAILKSYHRRLVMSVAVLSVAPWIIYGSLLLVFELGFGPPPIPEDALFGAALDHAFAVIGFVLPFILGMATTSLLVISCFVMLIIKYYREKSLQ